MRPTTLLQLPTKKYANFATTTPFVSPQFSENSKFSTSQLFQPLLVCHRGLLSRYNSKWDRERRESLHSEIILVWKTSINFGNSLLCISNFWIFNFLKKMTPPMAFVMERSNYHGRRVLIHTTGGNWLRITEMLRNYFETRVRNLGITKPPLKPYW